MVMKAFSKSANPVRAAKSRCSATRERKCAARRAGLPQQKSGKAFHLRQTVKNHLHNIFDKLGVSDRLELALYAIHHR